MSIPVKYQDVVIDWQLVDNLCFIHCTVDEICQVLTLPKKVLDEFCKKEHEVPIGEYVANRQLTGNVSLRRRQWDQAKAGNTKMQIHLGKHWLGQTEQTEIKLGGLPGHPMEEYVYIEDMPDPTGEKKSSDESDQLS